MSKKITVIGTGYVGLVAAVGLADFGNTLTGVDIDQEKIDNLNRGIPPIYEPGILEYLNRNLKSKQLSFSTDIEKAIREAEVVFIAVGTPPLPDGEVDLSQVSSVLDTISKNLNSYKVLVTKSTVPVGTNQWIKDELEKRAPGAPFDVVSNPEFLREGKAMQDFFHPDRIVVGYESTKAREVMEDIYRSLYIIQTPFVWCNLQTAELIKYASNAFLATKITFINQMANLSEAVGADIHVIAKSMGMDGRISSKFLHPGPGYGGSCFPKDTQAIVHIGKKYDVDMSIIKETIEANEKQKELVVSRLKKLMGEIGGKTIVLLGLAFKAETDDVRDSPAITIVSQLLANEVIIKAHDPKGMTNFAKIFAATDVSYYDDKFEALKDADGVIILTEWNEYRNMDLKRIKELMKTPVILDTRNVVDVEEAVKQGFTYKGLGR